MNTMKKIALSITFLLNCSILFAQYDSLNINNINARFYPDGGMFNGDGQPRFEVPKGSGKHSIYGARLWVGGLDVANQVHLSAEKYGSQEHDWFPGPLNTSGECDSVNYNRIWKINRNSVDSFAAWYQNQSMWPGYSPPSWVNDYPAVGNVNQGFSPFYFPFNDLNNDGWYNGSDGDYPKIRGDQSLFYIFNDNCGMHTATWAEPLGLEVRATAYAFDCIGDSALYNTIFVHYDIVNQSNITYYGTQVGIWSDPDLGDATDDYIASDVMRGAYYIYNGDDMDGFGNPIHYGENPPAQAVVFLGGPYQDGDNTDNEVGIGYNQSLTGLGYDDGIIDNERMGMMNFVHENNPQNPQTAPSTPGGFYNYMNGIWADGTSMVYGGNGHVSNCTTCDTARYMYPGTSDQEYFWGTNGDTVVPWSEVTAGNTPGDRRGLGSIGPFTFEPGDVQPLDVAFVFGRAYEGSSYASVENLKERIDAIREMFVKDSIPVSCGGSFTYTPRVETEVFFLNLYPNPATEILTVELPLGPDAEVELSVLDMTGKMIINKKGYGNLQKINIGDLSPGVYILKVGNTSKLFIKQ